MGICELCGKGGEGISMLGASHKELGWIMICQDCWQDLSSKNRMVAGSSCSGRCAGCPR